MNSSTWDLPSSPCCSHRTPKHRNTPGLSPLFCPLWNLRNAPGLSPLFSLLWNHRNTPGLSPFFCLLWNHRIREVEKTLQFMSHRVPPRATSTRSGIFRILGSALQRLVENPFQREDPDFTLRCSQISLEHKQFHFSFPPTAETLMSILHLLSGR